MEYISIGKILNFFGIKGEAKVGFSDINRIKNAHKVYMQDSPNREILEIEHVRLSKNFAIVKFKGIDDINSLIEFKGQRIFALKDEVLKKLDKNEFLIKDLINCEVVNEENEKIGTVVDVSENAAQNLLHIKNTIGKIDLVPFVDEFFPMVNIQDKKIVIKPIEGLLS